jgi:radical SAM superfamily enzyme YgiQ (UPF0313 family)
MDLIIFNPPRYSNGKFHKFNNAVLWLASYLHRRGVKVRIVPLNHAHYAETVEAELAAHRPKYVAISCKWWDTLYSATHIAKLVKQFDPGIVTISGGYTASFFALDLVNQTDFDVVIRGDGEEPLYRLVTGQSPVNVAMKGDTTLIPVIKQYVQSEEHLRELVLIDDLEEIISDTSVLNSYIWTGKGCAETCVYCAANALNNIQTFGRAKNIYRPIDKVLREVEILSRYPGSTRITFDFDPIRGLKQERFYLDLFAALPPKKYNCYFFSWSLPSTELIDSLARTFKLVELGIDVQVASERLRKVLGDRRYLKPFYSDEALDATLQHCHQYDNFIIDLSTLMGLPFETDEDVLAIKPFSDYFYDKYPALRYPYVSPMNVEPGSLLLQHPDRYEMVLFRRTFADFWQYTQRSFQENMNCYQPEQYGDGIFHPLGCASQADYARGDYFRTYETWKEVQKNIDFRSRQRVNSRMAKYMKHGLRTLGVTGGIDRSAVGGGEHE